MKKIEVKVLNQKWAEAGSVELNAALFWEAMNEGLVHRALVMQNANARTNVAHTLTRGERRGSTRKIYRQKWTGRARMGGNRSPIRKKGGVVFGPRNNQNFTLSMNKKERRKALACVLSAKLAEKNLIILDKVTFKDIKTKNMVSVLEALKIEKKVLVAIAEKNEIIEKSTSNIATAKTLLVDYLNIKDLLKYETLVIMKDSLAKLEARV